MSNIPPPPEGFEPIDDPRQIPPPPPGFELIGEPVPGMEKLGGVPPGPARPPQAVGAPPPPANRGDFASGIIGGAHGALSSLGGSVEIAGKLTGSDNLAALGGVIRADQAHKAEAYSKPVAELKNIKTGGDFLDWAQYNLGNLLPSMGASTAGAIAGGMVAGPVGAAAGAGLVSYLLNAGEVYSNLREQGVDAPGAAAAAGIPMAMLDAIEPTKIAGKLFFRPVAQTAAKKGITATLKDVGKRVVTEGLTEGLTEAGQEGIGAAAEDLAGGKTEFFSGETLSRMLNAAAAGTLGGVAAGAIPQRGAKPPDIGQAQQPPQAAPQTAPPAAPPPNAPVAPTAAAVPPSEEVTTEQDTPKPSIQRTVAALDLLGKAEGPLTKSALVDALEIGPREANDVLTTLLQQGDIQKTNKGYVLTGRTFAPPSPGEEAQPGQQIGILNQALQDPTDEEAPPAAGEAEPEPEPERPSDPAEPRAPKVEPAYGHNVQIAVPGEETKYPARFAIREAADVYPSHNPMSFEPNPGYEHQNDRDYKDPQNGARVMEYSTPAMFAPDYLIVDNPTAEHGPSVVDPRGNVLGGNNRAMTLRRVYGLSPQAAEKYKSTLRSRMERYGIDPAALDRFQHPVLVRERTSAIDAQREITDYNKKASAALRPGEQAITDGKRMSPRSIAAIVGRLEDAGENGSLADALRGENGAEVVQSLIADGVLTDQEASGMLEQRGKEQHLTAEAKLRIGKALVGRLFPNAQAFNNTSPEIRNKLERVAPHVVRSEGQKAWGLTEEVRQALEIMERLRAHGAKKITVPANGEALVKFAAPFVQRGWVKDLAPLRNQKGELTAEGKEKLTRLAYRLQEESVLTGQGALEEGKPQQFSPRALAIARTLRLPDKAAAAAFRRYANDEALSRPGAQGLMFEPPSPEEAFAEAFEAESPIESPVFSRGRRGAHQAMKGAFHLARVGGPRYQPGATLAVKSDEAAARVVTERGTPVIMVNGQGWDVLLHAAGMSEGGDANGVLMHPERVQRAIRRLRKGTALRAALDRVDSTQFVPIINTAEHFRDADLESALTEELDHLEQLNATGEIEHVPLREFFAMPEATKAAAHLERESGYEPEPAGMAVEIGVRLMRPGRYVELGLTPEEAVKLADHYVWLLRKRHGDAATRVIVGRVTKAFEDYVSGNEKALQFGHRRSRPESDGVDRGTEARGPPSDAGPVDEEERSRQLSLFARERAALARVEGVVAEKLPGRASGAQIESILRNPRHGIKPAELKQSGVLDWLREQRGPIDKTKALSFFAKRRAAVDANQQSLFGDLNPESLEQAEPKKPAPAPKPQRPSGPTMQGGLFDAAEEAASQEATRRDQAALQADEMQATIDSPLPPPKPKPTRRPPTGQGGLFDAQADLFSEPEPKPVSNDPATAKRIASAFTRAEQDGELPVPLAELRKRAGMDAEAFARAVIRLADEQKLTLTAHDHGGALTDAERRERGLVQDPDVPGKWYVAAAVRTAAPQEAVDEYVARIPDAEGEAEARVKKLDTGRFTVTFWDIDTNRKIDEGVRSFDTQQEAVAHARKRFKLDEASTATADSPAPTPQSSGETQTAADDPDYIRILTAILPEYVRAYSQYKPEVSLGFAKRDAERLAIIYHAIEAEPGRTTEQVTAALPDEAFPEFLTIEGERELKELTEFTLRGTETLVKHGLIHWRETDEITGAGGWHLGQAPTSSATTDTVPPQSQGGGGTSAESAPTPAPAGPAKMILTGDTYTHRNRIKNLPGGADWNGQRKGWIVDDTPENRAAVARMSKRILMGEWGVPRPPAPPVVEKELGSDATPITPGVETPVAKPATVESEEAPADDDAGSGRRGPERVPGGRQPAFGDDRGALEGELPEEVQQAGGGRSSEAASQGGGRPAHQDSGRGPSEGGRGGSVRTGDGGLEEPSRPADPVVHNPAPTTTSTPGSNTRFERDYRIPAERRVGGTPEKRFATNVAAIRTLRALEAEDRLPTKAEADILASYVGWGAVPQVFAANKPEWAQRQAELRELLTPEEYEHAKRSTTNAHYTSDGVVRAMWAAMQHLGAKPGMSWLEPAVGVGNFLGLQPAELLDGARRVALDKDTITGKIAQKLYPDSGVEVTAYEDAELPSEYFDAAVSNVPFGNFPVHDPAMKPQSLTGSIHNYFFAKSLHYVRPGGVVAFITSRYTMDGIDKPHQDFRNWIQSKADFLGAVRLPSGAFEEAAGTKVITDVIFLRRRLDGAAPAGDASWVTTGRKYLEARNQRGYAYSTPVDISAYYLNNPDNVLGEQALGRGMHADNEYTVKGDAGEQQVTDALKRILPKGAFQVAPQRKKDDRKRAAEVKGAQDAKVGALFFDEKGDVYRRTTKGTVDPVPMLVGAQDRLKRLLAIRNTLTQLLDAERTGKPDGALRQKLNLEYDIFKTKYGPINKRANKSVLEGDPDEPLLLSLETGWDGKTANKAEIFSKAVLAKPEVVHMTDSAHDALMVSLNEGGGINWDRMTALTAKTPEQLQKELQGVIFEVPTEGIWQTADEYLSGSVRKKLRQARAQAKVEPRFEANVKALEAVQPEDVTAGDIYARLGVTWVPSNVYEDFIRAALGLQPEAEVKVQYAPAIGDWIIEAPDWAATSAKYSTAKLGAGEIIKLGMNMRKPRITVEIDGEEVVDTAATAAANQKLDELQEFFQEWLLRTDPKRTEAIARTYNDLHNDLRLRQFDGAHLTLPGLNKDVKPFKHQLAAIWRVISQKNALLAHAVGAGKTLEAIAAGMELKRMGLVNRPMYVVPNATLSGWQEQFAKFYPGARVLVFTEKDLAKKNRQAIMARIATGSWDAVVVPHSSFQFLAVGDDLFQEHYEKLAFELEQALIEAKEGGMDTRLIKRMEKQKEALLANLKKRRGDEKKDKVVSWEQLGVDHLFVDESHEYKKLGFATKQGNIAGIDQQGNQKTFDLRMKMAHVQRHGRGVTFMTGTPITNTMGEMYTIMKYLIEPELKARGIGSFDEWAAQYGRTVAVWEPRPEGGAYQAKDRFAKFVNLPELLTLFRSFADVVTSDQLDIPRPAKKEYIITSQMTEEQEAFLERLQKRAEKIRKDPRRALPDNMLAVFGDAAKMALEQRMVIPEAPEAPQGRLSMAAEKIVARYKDSMRDKGTQLVFMDMGTPDGNAPFKTYGALIDKLVKLGIPRSEIAYIHQAKNKNQRAALFDTVRSGEIRVLIGSTGKMGTGVNVQDRIVAMHHLDLPARPADVEQRNGRGIRQGNRNAEVDIYTYLTAGTLDELKAASLARKATFIHNAMSGKLTARESEDIGEMAATFQAFQAATSRDPRIQRKMEVDAEVARLTAIRAAWRDQQGRLRAELATAPALIKRYQELIPQLEAAKRKRDEGGRVWEVGGERFEGEGIGNKVGEALTKVWAKSAMLGTLKELPLGKAHGFAVTLHKTPDSRYVVAVEGVSMFDAGQNPPDAGTVRSVENMLKGLEDKIEHAREDQARFERRMDELKAELAKPFPQQEKLKQYLQEQGELFAALDADQNDESAMGGGEVEDASVEAQEQPDSDEDEDAGGDEEEEDDGSLKSAAKKLLKDESGELRLDWFKQPPAVLMRLRNPAKAIAKALNPALVKAALAQVAPLDVRIERQGNGTGKALMDALRQAGDAGEVSAGKRMVKLMAAALDKLTKDERYNLLDVLEGRADPVNEKVRKAYTVSRALTDEIAAEAEDLEVQVRGHDGKQTFQGMEDYYPHVLRGVDALKSGPVRRDVLENLVRLEIRPDAEAAEKMLDQHIEFMEGGSKIPTAVVDYLIRTGQARNAADALAKLQRTRTHVKRQGNLEYAREVNLPFYDPDPARVLPTHVVGASIRLAQVAELGQDGQVVNRLIRDIAANGGNADWTRRAVDKIIGFANDADEEADKVSRFLRALQGFKLGLAVIPNATQSLNTLLLTDMPSVAKGIRAALTTEGQRYAIETGATLDPVLHETVRELATGSRHLEKFLKATGFSTIERFNRVVAANAGAAYTIRQLRALKADPKNLRARRKLAELGIDVDRAMERGKITGDELLIASKRLVDASQFRARPQDLPEFASDPWGKVFFQFKSFAYQQTRLVKQTLVNELRDREFGRGLRNLAILALLFPLAGEGVQWLRGMLTGRKRDEEGLMRYLDNAAAVGSLGILWDLIEGSRRRKFIETVAGPSAGMAADVLQTVATKPTDPQAWKKLAYRHAPLGSIGRRLLEGYQ